MATSRRRHVLAGLLAAAGFPTAVLREVVETIELPSGDTTSA